MAGVDWQPDPQSSSAQTTLNNRCRSLIAGFSRIVAALIREYHDPEVLHHRCPDNGEAHRIAARVD